MSMWPRRASALRHDGGDAHVEEGVGLALAVHAGETVDEAGDKELAGAVDDPGAFGDGHFGAGADVRRFCLR